VAVIEAVLAAKQGVKSITLGYGQCGNINQDVAALQTYPCCRRILAGGSLEDVEITTVFHQWMGGFPNDEARAFGVIALGGVAAALARQLR